MSEHRARVLLSLSHDARGRPFKIDEMRTEPTPRTGSVLLESDSTQARILEGRTLSMYASLRFPDRSRLRMS
jgi:hypothetical protein